MRLILEILRCLCLSVVSLHWSKHTLIARFMGPARGPPGSCRLRVGPMLAPWTLLSGYTHLDACAENFKDTTEIKQTLTKAKHNNLQPCVWLFEWTVYRSNMTANQLFLKYHIDKNQYKTNFHKPPEHLKSMIKWTGSLINPFIVSVVLQQNKKEITTPGTGWPLCLDELFFWDPMGSY